MPDPFSRTEMLLGRDAMAVLAASRVAVFGIGGVGGYAVEALARSGIGALDLIDSDRVSITNLNRQLHATQKTLGEYKVDVARERVLEINPLCSVTTYKIFFLPETGDQIDLSQFDYVIDAIDTVTGKLTLAESAQRAGIPIICAMGAGNKLDPTAFRVADLYETSGCPLARIMRKECRKRGIRQLKVVYSTELPTFPEKEPDDVSLPAVSGASEPRMRDVPGSVAFVPPVAGMILAGEVVKDLIRKKRQE